MRSSQNFEHTFDGDVPIAGTATISFTKTKDGPVDIRIEQWLDKDGDRLWLCQWMRDELTEAFSAQFKDKRRKGTKTKQGAIHDE